MMDPTQRVLFVVLVISIILIIPSIRHNTFIFAALPIISHRSFSPDGDNSAANTTLGFQAILAVSNGTPWRVNGLYAAAAYSEMDIKVPAQPHGSDQYLQFFEKRSTTQSNRPKHGSAKAWLAHLDILRFVIQDDLQTALILEDDVDWAVEIKPQMMKLASMVRKYTNTTASSRDPYGDGWDILWLGHCGEWYDAKNPPHVLSWPDETSGRRGDWRGIYDPVWLQDLPEGQRHLFSSVSPICTYAYAVSLSGAQKILEWASDGNAEAYDIHLAAGCQQGRYKCLSVVDHLFHHYRPPQTIGQGSDIANGGQKISQELNNEIEQSVGSTAVILHSARCQALFGTTCHDTTTMAERPF